VDLFPALIVSIAGCDDPTARRDLGAQRRASQGEKALSGPAHGAAAACMQQCWTSPKWRASLGRIIAREGEASTAAAGL